MSTTDVRDAPFTARARTTRAWIESVWAAYASQHEIAQTDSTSLTLSR